jgi:hypothetical protein
LVLGNIALAQPDCRSIIGAHLKPLSTSPFSWAVEGTGAIGLMPDRTIAHWSLYGALDFSTGKHQAYFEGTYKDWYNSASNPDGVDPQTGLPDYKRPTQYHLGFRELFYRYGGNETFIKAGIQGLKTEDYLLFDERMLGITAAKEWSAFSATANIGTVSQRLARFQDVCGTRHVYNLFHRSQFNFVGEKLGETNFAAAFLKWKPSKKKEEKGKQPLGNEVDEFSTDEFSSDEFESVEAVSEKKAPFKMEEMGLFFFEEFGTGFHEYKYYSGTFAKISLPAKFAVKAEIVDQYILNDHAIAYWVSIEKPMIWSNGTSTQIDMSYLGKLDISDDAHFYPAFSNLFLGEVMRLDAIDLPLLSGSVKHHFNGKLKPTIQLNGVMQFQGENSREIDFIAGVKLFDHARLTGIASYISSDLLTKDYWMTKLELRIAF